jgi:hypothetical protein
MLLLSARRKRRRQLLREYGQVTAFAFHDPSSIPDVLQESVEELVEKSVNSEAAWDDDEWWLEATDGR